MGTFQKDSDKTIKFHTQKNILCLHEAVPMSDTHPPGSHRCLLG